MKKVIIVLVSLIAALGAIAGLAFTAVELAAFDIGKYERAYDQYDRYEFIGISKDDLMQVTRNMLDYLKGKRGDLIMYADIQGEQQQVFEERELLHMEDVKGLFDAGFLIRNIGAIAAVLGVAALILLNRKKWLKNFSVAYLSVLAVAAVLIGLLLIAMMRDFTGVFIKFHLLLFNNDLWLLDIDTDVLIQMFPEEFFNSMALAIGAYSVISLIVPATAMAVYLIVEKCKKNGKADAI